MTVKPEDYYLYWYTATVVNVVDGDTLDVDTDLGFRIRFHQRIRLYGVDAYELNDPDPERRELAKKAKTFVEAEVLGKRCFINTYMDRAEKYGRWLADIWYLREGEYRNLNQYLVEIGLARKTG